MKRSLQKLEMSELVTFILILVIAGIAAMIDLNVNENIKTSSFCPGHLNATSRQCFNETNETSGHIVNTLEWNASVDGSRGVSNITAQFPNIGLVIAAVVIIGLLIAGFAFAFTGRGGTTI